MIIALFWCKPTSLMRCCYLLILCYFALFTAFAQPIIRVTPSGAGDHSGSSWSNALSGTALAGSVATATSGTQFWVAAGTYYPTTTGDRTASFSIASGVQVYGNFAGSEEALSERTTGANETVFSGDINIGNYSEDNSYHVIQFYDVSESTLINGITISHGYSELNIYSGIGGGGILNVVSLINSSPTIKDCKLIDNYAYYGGGIANVSLGSGNASVYINDCLFMYNHAQTGGAIVNYGGGTPESTAVNRLELLQRVNFIHETLNS